MEMHKYKFTIKHDGGKHVLSTTATDVVAAMKIVMAAERCPERAIINIKIEEIGNKKTKREPAQRSLF